MGNINSVDKKILSIIHFDELKAALQNGSKLLTFASFRRKSDGTAYSENELERARQAVSKLRAYTPEYHNQQAAKPSTDSTSATSTPKNNNTTNNINHNGASDSILKSSFHKHDDSDARKVSFAENPSFSDDELGSIKVLERDLNGNFGFELLAGPPENGIKVYSVNDGSPAAFKGVEIDSILIEVDSVNVYGMSYSEITELLNNASSTVELRFGSKSASNNVIEEAINRVINESLDEEVSLKLQAHLKHVIDSTRQREGREVDPNLTQRLMEDQSNGGLLEFTPKRHTNANTVAAPTKSTTASSRSKSNTTHSTATKLKPKSTGYGYGVKLKKKKGSTRKSTTTPTMTTTTPPPLAPPLKLNFDFEASPNSSTRSSSNPNPVTTAATPQTPTNTISTIRTSTDVAHMSTTPSSPTFDFDNATIYDPNESITSQIEQSLDTSPLSIEDINLDLNYSIDTNNLNLEESPGSVTPSTSDQPVLEKTPLQDLNKQLELANDSFDLYHQQKAVSESPPLVKKAKKRFDNSEYGQPMEDGITLKMVGSKHHAQMMGLYKEMEHLYNGTAVFCKVDKVSQAILFCLYYHDKSWRISPSIGKKKCSISTTSPVATPDKAKSIWYEARGPNGHTMQGHPGLSCELHKADPIVNGGLRRPYVNRKLKLST